MRTWWLIGMLALVGCGSAPPAGGDRTNSPESTASPADDLAARPQVAALRSDEPATASSAPFECDPVNGSTETCSGDQYCYRGSESPNNYSSDSGVAYGCNPLPADCAATPTCACVLSHYQPGFCTCDDRAGIKLFCSLA